MKPGRRAANPRKARHRRAAPLLVSLLMGTDDGCSTTTGKHQMKLLTLTAVAAVIAIAAYAASSRNECHADNPLYQTSYCADF